MKNRPQWIELRAHGRMWARYNPHLNQIEFARQELRVVFNLSKLQRLQQNEDATLQPEQKVVESLT